MGARAAKPCLKVPLGASKPRDVTSGGSGMGAGGLGSGSGGGRGGRGGNGRRGGSDGDDEGEDFGYENFDGGSGRLERSGGSRVAIWLGLGGCRHVLVS